MAQSFRFRVEDPTGTRGSSTWYAAASRTTFSLGAVSLGAYWRLSCHPPADKSIADGYDTQFGPPADYRRKLTEKGIPAPNPLRWTRPATPISGATCIAAIKFPYIGLRSKGDVSKKRHSEVLIASAGTAIDVLVCLSRAPLTVKNGRSIHEITMTGTGDYVTLVERTASLEPSALDAYLAPLKSHSGKPLDGAPSVGSTVENASGLAYDLVTEDGHLRLLAVEITGLAVTRRT